MAKKTVSIKDVVTQFNSQLLNSDFQDLDHTEGKMFRMGLCSAIEHILHSTGNYKGYRYIDKAKAIKPYAYGCDYSKITGDPESKKAALADGDDSRRQYSI